MMNNRISKSLIFFLLLLGVMACGDKKEPYEDFLGTWQLSQKIVNSQVQNLLPCELNATIEFKEYNLCKHYDACKDTLMNDSWSYTEKTLNINSLLPLSFEVEEVSNAFLQLISYDFDEEGELRVSQFEYSKISE